ncbi:MAG: DLW-39 family protein [Nocardioidaceae bacterium]
MLKKILAAAIVGVAAKFVLDRLTGGAKEADLWAEATDPVDSSSR